MANRYSGTLGVHAADGAAAPQWQQEEPAAGAHPARSAHPHAPRATKPPCCHPHDRRAGPRRPLPLQAALLPFRLVHGVFGLTCRATLGPLRAVLGQQIPMSNRRHLIFVPERFENMLGALHFTQTKAEGGLLPGRHADVQLVTRVARRIIAALPQPDAVRGYVGHLSRCSWEFVVVDSPTINAFVVPGGKVVVYTGLLDMVGRDEDKLAAILGHEAAHVIARHGSEGMGLRLLLAGVSWVFCQAASYIFADARVKHLQRKLQEKLEEIDKQHRKGTPAHTEAVEQAYEEHERALMRTVQQAGLVHSVADLGSKALTSLLVGLPNSRRAESEADLIGLKVMAKAGFDIRRAPAVWDDFQRDAGGLDGAAALLATHPGHASRKRFMEEEVAHMQALGWRKGRVPQAALENSCARRGYFSI